MENWAECVTCGIKHNNKRFCSRKCYSEYMKTRRGDKAPNWKNGKVRKESVHQWLDANYGKERICEIGNCTRACRVYDWALKKGCEYEKKRENFMRLCRSCHRRYDLTEEKKNKAIKNLMEHNPYASKSSYKKYMD